MKQRIMIFVLLFSFGLIITGCGRADEFSDDQKNDELCSEEPNHELCDPDIIEQSVDVSKADAKTALETFIEYYFDDDVSDDTICAIIEGEDDDCKYLRQKNSYFEMNIIVNSIIETEQKNLFIAQLTYVNEFSDVSDAEVEFEVEVSESGNVVTMYKIVTEELHEITLEETQAVFSQFFEDFMNQEITSEFINNMYFSSEMMYDEERIGDLDDSLYEITSISDVFDEDGYIEVTIAFDEDDATTSLFSASRTYDGYIIDFMESYSSYEPDPAEMLEEKVLLFESYLADYLDPNITINQLNEKYYTSLFHYQEFEDEREADLSNNVQIDIIDAYLYYWDYLYIELGFTVDGITEIESLLIYIDVYESSTYIEFLNKCYGCTTEVINDDEFLSVFELYLIDYLDDTISSESLSELYFYDRMPYGYELERNYNLENGVNVELIDIQLGEEMDFEVSLRYTEGSVVKEETYVIHMFYVMQDNYKLYIEHPLDQSHPDKEDAINKINTYFEMYHDPSISNEMITNMFIGYQEFIGYDFRRNSDLENGVTYIVSNIDDQYAEYGDYGVDLIMTKDGVITTFRLMFMARYNYGEIMFDIIADYDNSVPTEEDFISSLNTYLENYLDSSISGEDLVSMHLLYYPGDMFSWKRDMDLEKMTTYTITQINNQGADYGYYEIELEVVTDGQTTTENYHVTTQIQYGEVRLNLENLQDYTPPEYNDFVTTFNSYIEDYLDSSISDDDLTKLYYNSYPVRNILDNRADDLEDMATYTIENISTLGAENGMYEILLSVTVDGTTTTETVYVRSYYYYGVIKLEESNKRDILSDFAYIKFGMVEEEILNETSDIDQICLEHFTSDSYDLCYAISVFHRENNYRLEMYSDSYNEGLKTVYMETYDSGYEFIEYNIFSFELVLNEDGVHQIYIESTGPENNPLYNETE